MSIKEDEAQIKKELIEHLKKYIKQEVKAQLEELKNRYRKELSYFSFL